MKPLKGRQIHIHTKTTCIQASSGLEQLVRSCSRLTIKPQSAHFLISTYRYCYHCHVVIIIIIAILIEIIVVFMIIRTALELESFCKIQIARRDMTAIVIIMDSDKVGMQLFQLLLFVTTILRLEMKSDMYKGNICPLSLPLFSC